jgi:hypothetical protein
MIYYSLITGLSKIVIFIAYLRLTYLSDHQVSTRIGTGPTCVIFVTYLTCFLTFVFGKLKNLVHRLLFDMTIMIKHQFYSPT